MIERSPPVGGNKFIAVIRLSVLSGGLSAPDWSSKTPVGGSLARVVGLEALIEFFWHGYKCVRDHVRSAMAGKLGGFAASNLSSMTPVLKVPLNFLKGFQNSGQRQLVFISIPLDRYGGHMF